MQRIYLLLIILCLSIANNSFCQSKILFRFNADYDLSSELNSSVDLKQVTYEENQFDEDKTARASYGWNYSESNSVRFADDSSRIISKEQISYSNFGDSKISGEIWFRTANENGSLFEWDDSTKKNGVQLYIKNGLLIYEAKVNHQKYVGITDSKIKINKWVRLNWIFHLEYSNLKIQSYINDELCLENSFSLSENPGLVFFNSNVKIGSLSYAESEIPNFEGYIYAANIKNYIPPVDYIETTIPYDGTGYLGIAKFHDYSVGSLIDNIDQRIAQNSTPVDTRVYVPYVNDDFVPQGLTNSYEDEKYINEVGYIYGAMYNLTVDKKTRLKNSIVVEYDPQNEYKVRRCFRLNGVLGTSHVGGIAFYNNSIYVSSSHSIERYKIPEYNSNSKYIDLSSSTDEYWSVQSTASFVNYYKDTLWVGDYVASSESSIPYLYGYPVNNEGEVNSDVQPKIYRLPKQSQGVAWKSNGSKEYLFISRSSGDNNSFIDKVSRQKLSKYVEALPDTTLRLPAGGEDITFDKKGNLINISESSAIYYQKRSNPWNTYYPFMFVINKEYLLKDIAVGVKQNEINQNETANQFSAYPNPFNGSVKLNYFLKSSSNHHIVIYSILGEKVESSINENNESGWYTYTWNPSTVSSGTYIATLIVDGRIVNSNKIIYLK